MTPVGTGALEITGRMLAFCLVVAGLSVGVRGIAGARFVSRYHPRIVEAGDETTDIGTDAGTLVRDDYGQRTPFTGEVEWVQIDIDDAAENVDHLITAEDRWRIAMARQ